MEAAERCKRGERNKNTIRNKDREDETKQKGKVSD